MMEADGAELMKEDVRQRRTVESRIGRNEWRRGKLWKEANGIGGSFWCSSGGEERTFFFTG